jgi:hypothetical protein
MKMRISRRVYAKGGALYHQREAGEFSCVSHELLFAPMMSNQSSFAPADILQLPVIREHDRAERKSHKLDFQARITHIACFFFENPPERPSELEACRLRHLTFAVDNLGEAMGLFARHGRRTGSRRPNHRQAVHVFL